MQRGCGVIVLAVVLAGCGGHSRPSAAAHAGPIVGPPPPGASTLATTPPPTVVKVDGPIRGGSQSAGTGWVYDVGRALVVTAFQVINGSNTVQVVADGIDPTRQTGAVIAASPCDAIALIQMVDASGLKPLKLASESALRPGRQVTGLGWATGYAGRTWQPTTGKITRVRVALGPRLLGLDKPPVDDLLETTTLGLGGKAGGPVIDSTGRLVAMMAFTHSEPGRATVSGSIRVDRLRQVLASFRHGRARGWIGSGLFFPGQDQTADGQNGVVVTGIHDTFGSYANAGVLVTKVNGIGVGHTLASWCRTVGAMPPGRAAVTIIRDPSQAAETVRIPINEASPSG